MVEETEVAAEMAPVAVALGVAAMMVTLEDGTAEAVTAEEVRVEEVKEVVGLVEAATALVVTASHNRRQPTKTQRSQRQQDRRMTRPGHNTR